MHFENNQSYQLDNWHQFVDCTDNVRHRAEWPRPTGWVWSYSEHWMGVVITVSIGMGVVITVSIGMGVVITVSTGWVWS